MPADDYIQVLVPATVPIKRLIEFAAEHGCDFRTWHCDSNGLPVCQMVPRRDLESVMKRVGKNMEEFVSD